MTVATAQTPAGGRSGPTSLGRVFSDFAGYPGPRLLLSATGAAIGSRLAVGRWSRKDVAVAAGILGAEPFTEWVIHVLILHMKPRVWRGRRVDPLLARKHRDHHRDPTDAELILVPAPVLRLLVGLGGAAGVVAGRRRAGALTGVATSFAMLSLYEWTHFLIHSAYRPRHRPYRTIWRAHRLHHFRNEHYWFGVTVHLADRALGTYPRREDVPLSATARTLGVTAPN